MGYWAVVALYPRQGGKCYNNSVKVILCKEEEINGFSLSIVTSHQSSPFIIKQSKPSQTGQSKNC